MADLPAGTIELSRTDQGGGSVLIRVDQMTTIEKAADLGMVGSAVVTFNNGHSHAFLDGIEVISFKIDCAKMLDQFVVAARPGDNSPIMMRRDQLTMVECTAHLGQAGKSLCTYGNGRSHAIADTYDEFKAKLASAR
jgi:hypothetical protein